MSTIRLDIEGLNLILGGGIPMLQRHPDFAGESATLLVRGPPGSGKTVFGAQLAGSIGQVLKCDVAYGCVEILPSELAAQRAGVKRPEVKERVVQAPFGKPEARGEECRMFAGMLDLGAPAESEARLTEAVGGLLDAIKDVGGVPGVLVIDSLSDGYGLGASAPRALADDLCKMAAQLGMVLILLEEVASAGTSPWSFACDVVLELGVSEIPNPTETIGILYRHVTVTKHRFAASEIGPHRFIVSKELGVQIYPTPTAYLRPWALDTLLPRWERPAATSSSWGYDVQWRPVTTGNRVRGTEALPPFETSATLVYGPGIFEVVNVTGSLGAQQGQAFDVFLNLCRDPQAGPRRAAYADVGLVMVQLGDPALNPDQVLHEALLAISAARAEGMEVGRVIVGDLALLPSFWAADRITRALEVLVAVLRRARIPMVLFEKQESGISPLAHLANVTIRLLSPSHPIDVTVMRAQARGTAPYPSPAFSPRADAIFQSL